MKLITASSVLISSVFGSTFVHYNKLQRDYEKWEEHLAASVVVSEGSVGNWGPQVNCPIDYYTCGFKVKTGKQGDHTGVAGLHMMCCHRNRAAHGYLETGSPDDADQLEVQVHSGQKFEEAGWSDWKMCPQHSYVKDLKIKHVPNRGQNDDVELAKIEMDCAHLCCNEGTKCNKDSHKNLDAGPATNELPSEWVHPYGFRSYEIKSKTGYKKYLTVSKGTWVNSQYSCGDNRAMCGIKLRATHVDDEDRTGITGVSVACCNGLLEDIVDSDVRREQSLNCF